MNLRRLGYEWTKSNPPYLPHVNLVDAVNLAIFLEKPLLLKGDPGCGKTQLAYAVSQELGLPLETWPIKSTSRAQDGLYTYDTVGRLRDAQLISVQQIKNEAEIKERNDPNFYLRWGVLGKAFRQQDKQAVVLIDEIDKADIDFPNDLLWELEKCSFAVEETGEKVTAYHKPIVFITSNDEKDLPDAFLRRCLFHFVKFPDEPRLKQILEQVFPKSNRELLNKAIKRFMKLRDLMQEDKSFSGKKVSTSELIDWFTVLSSHPNDEAFKILENQILPFPEVLLKSWEDHQRYLAKLESP
jgi:MoxR-like ATPase